MKKMLLIIAAIVFMPYTSHAQSLLDQIYTGFVGNAKFAFESNTKGQAQPMFLDNFIEIGNLNGDHLAALDVGVLGTILPDNAHFQSADWTSGAKVHLAPILKSRVHLPSEWQFLGTLEIDARASYNWTQRHPFYGIAAAYPFK